MNFRVLLGFILAVCLILFIWLIVITIVLIVNVDKDNFLNAYTDTPQTLNAGDGVVFNRNRVLSGTAISHAEGSSQISLNQPGVYQISYNVTVEASVIPPTEIVVWLELDGAKIAGSESYTPSVFMKNQTVSASVIVTVNTPSIIELVNQSTGVIYTNANIVVVKLN